jgi:hypothetical protein
MLLPASIETAAGACSDGVYIGVLILLLHDKLSIVSGADIRLLQMPSYPDVHVLILAVHCQRSAHSHMHT